ncbi:hypothetical protein BGW80DRAFT_383040 [Lactifluus volemus]|nr:hypothetical protein BGW80DRAFT_383040 [Lactifluus volemus]
MSEAAHPEPIDGEGINMSGPPNQPAQNQPLQGKANFSDGSDPLFNMYVKMTEGEDDKMAHRWQKDADGILIFTGLFSAALAALLTVSVQDLKPNPQDTSAFYLANIYKLQVLAFPNISSANISSVSFIPVQPPPFFPVTSAIWVNSLWFLSLVVSLTCALLATLLQQWARRYVTITQPPRYSHGPHKRAPIRAFFADGVEKFHLHGSVEALPALLHLSLFLFFSGLAIYLFNINYTVFSAVVWWVGLAGAIYVCVTLMPIFWHDSPYYAPLSSSVWRFYNGVSYTILELLGFLWPGDRYSVPFFNRMITYRIRFIRGITNAIQDTSAVLSAETSSRILEWIIQALYEDKELERFFEAIPGFCGSTEVGDLESIFSKVEQTLIGGFSRFMRRTLSSSLVLEADKERRVITCVKTVDTAHLSYATMAILGTVFDNGEDVLRSVEMGRSLRSSGDKTPGLCSQGIIAGIIASVPEREDRWMEVAKDQLRVSDEVLRGCFTHGDSVLLANLIHITRPLFSLCLGDISNMVSYLWDILPRISKFDIENTLPALQRDFCALWNEITREAQDRGSYHIAYYILRPIRHHYIEAPMLPGPLPQTMRTPFCSSHRHTHCAISRLIAVTARQARPLILSRPPPTRPLPTLPTPF